MGFRHGWVQPTDGFRYPSPLQRRVFPGYGLVVAGVMEPSFAVVRTAPGGRWDAPQQTSAYPSVGGVARDPVHPRAMSIQVGSARFAGGFFYSTGGFRHPSPLLRSVFPPDACYGIYRANVAVGRTYALNINLPQTGPDTRVYLADRWPMMSNANLHRLPMAGQGGPLARGLYRWRFGIAPYSYGSVVYIVVVAPWLCGGIPPYYGVSLDPWLNGGYGAGSTQPIMQANGPLRMVLAPAAGRRGTLSGRAGVPVSMPLAGDLVTNPVFTHGLLDWSAVRAGKRTDDIAFVRVTRQGLKLSGSDQPGSVGVRQNLNADVSGVSALILQARLKVGVGADAGETSAPALTIKICYRDTKSGEHCGANAFRYRFMALLPGVDVAADVQPVPAGRWYQETFDLMTLKPRPARIESLMLLAPRQAGQSAWVRDIHLLVRPHESD